ncbi:MAG: CvpA family protein [Planctomycetota bacterium]
MALVIVLLVLVLTFAFFHLKCTMMQSFVMLWSSVVSTILAFSFYEFVAELLVSRGYGLQWAHCGSYLVVFIAGFALLRTVSEFLIGTKIDLGDAVKASTAAVCGLLTGLIFSGNLLVVMGMLPMQGKVFYSRFDPSEPVVLSQPKAPALATDGFVSGLYGLISSGSMKSDKSFRVYHADYLSQIHLNKLKVKDKVLTVSSREAIEMPSKKKQPVRSKAFDDKEYIVVRMGIKGKKIDKGGANNASGKIEFFPAQIRLIVKDDMPGLSDNLMAGSAKALPPVGFLKDGRLVKVELDKIQSPDSKEQKEQVLWLDVAFDVPQNHKPVLIQFKQNAVADLTSYKVVESTPEIESALDSDDEEKEG